MKQIQVGLNEFVVKKENELKIDWEKQTLSF